MASGNKTKIILLEYAYCALWPYVALAYGRLGRSLREGGTLAIEIESRDALPIYKHNMLG
jgi:hypothetical protein